MPYLRLLFWLKWKLMWRGYSRGVSAALGAILALVLFFPLALGMAFFFGWGFRALAPPLNEHMLRAVLLSAYAFWLLTPLLGYALNDSYDITRLFVYPLTVRQIFTGAILGSLLDFTILFLLPTLVAVLWGFTHDLASFLLVAPAVALFLFHTLSMSQAILLGSAGMLRSRRFRDIVIVLMPLLWIAYYVVSQSLSRQTVRVDWRALFQSPVWEGMNYLPPGLAARAVAAAGRGEYVPAAGFLLALAACTVGTVYLAGWLIQKVYDGEIGSAPARRQRQQAVSIETGPAAARAELEGAARAPFGITLPPVVQAVADKEVKYLARDPFFKVALMNLLYMLVVAGFVFLRPSRQMGLGGGASGMAWGAAGLVLLSEMQLLFNIFGTEGTAASVLFLFPGSRRQMLIGKNLTLFVALSAVNLAFMLIVAALARTLHLFGPLFCWMELALMVFIGVGNLTSIWFPTRVAMRGWRTGQQSAGRGCGFGLLYLGVAGAAYVLLLPILAALLVPSFWVSPVWFALTIPLAVAYAVGLYALSLHLSEPLLLRRELEIIEKVGETE